MKQSSKLYNPHPSIESLKNNQITQVLSEGFAMIYHTQPQFPITYLSQFLLNYMRNKNQTNQLQNYRNRVDEIKSQNLKEEEYLKSQNQEAERERLKEENRSKQFRRQVEKQKEPRRFLNKFCTWLQQSLDVSAIYIGQLKYPKKDIVEKDMAEMAHLDTEQPKRIEYIASSENQEHIIVGKSLTASSLTGSLFEKREEEKQQKDPAQNEGNKNDTDADFNHIYVPNVIKDNRITYLRFPKLGAYLGVAMPIKSYLNQNSFEVGFENTLKHNKDREQLDKELERKENEFRQQYDERVKNEAGEKELEEMEQNFEKEKENMMLDEVEIPFEELQFVVCADTLGLQKQIQQKTKKQIFQYVTLLKNSWQKKQHQRIKEDIDNQVSYLQLFESNIQDTIQKILQNQEKDPEDMAEFERFKVNEKQYQFEIDSSKLEKIKQLLTDEKYQTYYSMLTGMNVLRFQPLMQMVLYFLGYKKKDINIEGTNILDWNKIRGSICNQSLIDKLVEYTHRGSKPEQIQPYAKWSQIISVLQKMDYNSVLGYNLFYGALLKYMMMTAKLRRIDGEIRKQKLAVLRAAREDKIRENQRLEEQKERIREEQRAALEGNTETPFDEEAWEAQYNEEHPLVEIEPDYEAEIDQDLEDKDSEETAEQQQ